MSSSSSSSSAAPPSDEEIRRQVDEISKEVAAQQPLVGELEDPSSLADAYADNPVFLPKIASLAETFSHIRRTRGDGSCFYRSFLVSMGEAFIDAKVSNATSPLRSYFDWLLNSVQESEEKLVAFGYSQFTVSDFLDALKDYLNGLVKPDATKESEVYGVFRDQPLGFYIITALRCLCSLEILSNEDAYLPFIMGLTDCVTAKQFVDLNVDAVNTDADQVQVMAIANGLKCKVLIAYLDATSTPDNKAQLLEFPQADDGSSSAATWPLMATVLYRPGHYDIAYKKKD